MNSPLNRRILLIDDNESIHDDFKKILLPVEDKASNLADMRAAFLGGGEPAPAVDTTAEAGDAVIEFDITSATQGQEGYERLCEACDAGEPFAMAFVDMRMPPGWDGVQTIVKLWERDPDLQVVVCTAFSDYTWEETVAELGQSDQLLILKKPFDAIEIFQLAAALTNKWNTAVHERELLEGLRRAEAEARAYASSLETVNQSLVTAKAAADMAADLKTEFLVRLTGEVQCRLSEVLGNVEGIASPETQDPAARAQIETVLDIGRHLLQTIDEILEVTTLEIGDAELEVDACKPLALVEDVLEELRPQAELKGLALDFSCGASVPETIDTEERHLRKLLTSLVENAVHYTDSGSVRVCLALESTESWRRTRLRFEVRDTGRGIPRERLGSIFEPCARDEGQGALGDESGPAAGYGFGLALAKRLAAVLGGDLSVESTVGSGSVFRLTIEAQNAPAAERLRAA